MSRSVDPFVKRAARNRLALAGRPKPSRRRRASLLSCERRDARRNRDHGDFGLQGGLEAVEFTNQRAIQAHYEVTEPGIGGLVVLTGAGGAEKLSFHAPTLRGRSANWVSLR